MKCFILLTVAPKTQEAAESSPNKNCHKTLNEILVPQVLSQKMLVYVNIYKIKKYVN